ncbi:MAG: DNA adenine methylase [Chitinophagaceae bacterium]|nr:DNA adenine methylase [Chitinophagaceae bacterium]
MTAGPKIISQKAGNAKPFLKWAGGKGQLIGAIEAALPKNINDRENLTYIEPFIGSGAILFWLLQRYPSIKKAVINDINTDLTNAYTVIKENPFALIDELQQIQADYYKLTTEEKRKSFYLQKRTVFNERRLTVIKNTATLIFLNRTCFNGLYRVNSRNEFNVPFGKYDKPKICDEDTILADSKLLQRVTILNGDFRDTLKHADKNSFFYFDPPYKPISKTSSFNAYAKDTFNDAEQERLKKFCDEISAKGHQWLLSNSDPGDNFFENLYSGKNIYIHKVKARRSINSVASKRGEIAELLISNYRQSF